jgi:transposase InsO family protein
MASALLLFTTYRQLMLSRSGNVWDNAAMESFFSSLKTERTARKTYRTRDEAKADVFDYIGGRMGEWPAESLPEDARDSALPLK